MHKFIANDIINFKIPILGFNNYSFIYRNTNENIQGYLLQLPIKNSDILTVASSGDHALLSWLNGAKSVETYDLNHLAKFYQELKLSGYQSLSFDDFYKFFFTDKGFTYEIFEKIITLPPDAEMFWQYLFDYNDDYAIIDSPLFSNFEYNFNALAKSNPFLKKENYQTKKPINNLTFYQCDALKLSTILKKKYDIIMLSSIPNFINQFRNLLCFREYLEKLSEFLNDDGIIIANYLYNIGNKNDVFKNDDLIKKAFQARMTKITFPSLSENVTDAVLLYKK